MDQRLTTLYTESAPQHAPGSVLLLKACALHHDNLTQQYIAQLKWQNLSQRTITAALISLSCTNAFGHEMKTTDFQYDLLTARPGEEFGSKVAISMGMEHIQHYTVALRAVRYEDGTVWEAGEPLLYQPLPDAIPQPLTGDLLAQYKRELYALLICREPKYQPQQASGLWQCLCGSWQPSGTPCLACGANLDMLLAAGDPDLLQAHLDEYNAEMERRRIEAEKAEAERRRREAEAEAERRRREAEAEAERRRLAAEEWRRQQKAKEEAKRIAAIRWAKIKRIACITAICAAAVAILACALHFFILPAYNYSRAERLIASQQWAEASAAFEAAGSYQDAASRIPEPFYLQGEHLMAEEKWTSAIEAFKRAGRYRDAPKRISYCTLRRDEAALAASTDTGALVAIANRYKAMPTYLDCTERAEAILNSCYERGAVLIEAGSWDEAIALYTALGSYRDASHRVTYYGIRRDEAALYTAGDLSGLAALAARYDKMGDFLDSSARAEDARDYIYDQAATLAQLGRWDNAVSALSLIPSHSDATNYSAYCIIRKEEDALPENAGHEALRAVAALYAGMGDYRDCAARTEALATRASAIGSTGYAQGQALMQEGRWAEAADVFEQLGSYSDAAEHAVYCAIRHDEATLGPAPIIRDLNALSGRYAAMNGFLDSAARAEALMAQTETAFTDGMSAADALIAQGQYAEAAAILSDLGEPENAELFSRFCTIALHTLPEDGSEPIQRRLSRRISGGFAHTVILPSDGAAVSFGSSLYRPKSIKWNEGLVAVDAGSWHSVGLRSDGTVIADGINRDHQCDVSGWTDIVAIASGTEFTLGLRADGTVVATGDNTLGQCDVSQWRNIVALDGGDYFSVGLTAEGTIVTAGNMGTSYFRTWTDIVDVAAGNDFVVGLKADGTVVTNYYNAKALRGWSDIVAISVGTSHIVGLRADGTVVAAGYNSDGQCNVSDWTDIVAIGTGNYHTIGLRADGTLVSAGSNDDRQLNFYDFSFID